MASTKARVTPLVLPPLFIASTTSIHSAVHSGVSVVSSICITHSCIVLLMGIRRDVSAAGDPSLVVRVSATYPTQVDVDLVKAHFDFLGYWKMSTTSNVPPSEGRTGEILLFRRHLPSHNSSKPGEVVRTDSDSGD